jgi:hypothetical protein
MPHRRRKQKGSFGGHLDELVKHFPHDETRRRKTDEQKKPSKDDANVHDKLLESAWRKARDNQSSRFSNQ